MVRFGVNRAFAECGVCGHPRMAHFVGGCYCGCAGEAPAEDRFSDASAANDIVSVLHARASAQTRADDVWELVNEAARLRTLGQAEEALEVLRRANEAATSPREQIAAATVNVAALCDLWRDEEARRVGESALEIDDSDPYLLRALGRAWFLGYAATGVDSFRVRADEYFERADEIDALSAASATA